MRYLEELPLTDVRAARDAAQTLASFKAYMPPGGLLLMLASKFADDAGDVLGIEAGPVPRRGRERRPLDELTSAELDTVAGAVSTLLQDFTKVMDDPALPRLLREFRDGLDAQKAERAQLQEEIGAS